MKAEISCGKPEGGSNHKPRKRLPMLQGLLAPLLLAASVAVVGAMPSPEQCKSEMNKIKDLLEMSCVDKGLTNIPSGLPKDTGILLLASNQLAKVALASFQHLPQLSELDLSNNSLKALETGSTLPELKQLLLSHNGLESLPAFPGLPSLRRLALGHNQLSQLPEGSFRDLGQLHELELQGNRLQSLPGRAFEGLPMLKDLDLSDNCLEVLPPELLAELPKLEILRLERNRLERVPDGFFSGTEYAYIYLVGNPWLCDCRLDYLRKWINDNEFFVYTRMTVQEDGFDKEVTENEPQKVHCQAPPEEKGQPVMSFEADCPAGESWTPSPITSPSMATAPLTPQFRSWFRSQGSAWRRSSHSPSTAISPTGAALTTTTSTSGLSSTMTHSPTTTSPGPTTILNILTTSTAVVTFGLSTSGATAGRSTATSNGPMTAPGPSTAHVPTPRVPTTMGTSCTPLPLSPTALMITTPLPPKAPPTTTTAAGHPPSPAALVPSTLTPTHVKSSPRISAPLSTHKFFPPPPPKPSADCLCPALPVRVLGVAARKGSNTEWLAGSCCLLRLVLYLVCLALVALPTLALLCWLGWLYLSWYRQAVRGAPGSRLVRPQQWQKASPKGWQPMFAEAPRPTSGPRIYRVCKKFQVAPSRHITWMLVSLPGSAGKWAQMQARLSSYSLDRGKDTLGAVRVKYAAASL
ncbi:platelet glycoprotein Ib alpha chain isoform X2 [Ahaetulla prasina]|uniref:platelet glycoprotein Ib alpha chain isoform X2 n=1 Tax=Ahaetulla prasina TaxID=499056 RepID=UPI0026483C28|nr:platelet glycoprotein Ib alpha chain isoform X2 [Ahaetulla prasina]